MKTLTIMIGNARGGEETWNTYYKYLLDMLNSDLALCFGLTNDKSSSLYAKANYIWEMPEYNNWREYYETNCSGFWEQSLLCGSHIGAAGGIDDYTGSGSIIFAFRHFIKNNYKDILLNYQRIILTRSDFYYVAPHPDLPNSNIWIPEGEDYSGFTDRHIVFDSKYIDQVLGVVEYIDSENGFKEIQKLPTANPESILKSLFIQNNVVNLVKRFPRIQFTVKTQTDTSRWSHGCAVLPNGLYVKYIDEYNQAINNINSQA